MTDPESQSSKEGGTGISAGQPGCGVFALQPFALLLLALLNPHFPTWGTYSPWGHRVESHGWGNKSIAYPRARFGEGGIYDITPKVVILRRRMQSPWEL